MNTSALTPVGAMNGPFKMSFSWRAQLGAALFVLGRNGDAGAATLAHLWGRPWTVDDPVYDEWNASDWYQFAVKVVTLSIAVGGRRPGNLPIEPALIEAALTATFGPNPPDATFHLPQRPHHLLVPE